MMRSFFFDRTVEDQQGPDRLAASPGCNSRMKLNQETTRTAKKPIVVLVVLM